MGSMEKKSLTPVPRPATRLVTFGVRMSEAELSLLHKAARDNGCASTAEFIRRVVEVYAATAEVA
jgi:hypothetical protein